MEMDGNLWKGISVEVDHDLDTSLVNIVETAKETIRDLLILVGVGRGLELSVDGIHVWPLLPINSENSIGMIECSMDTIIVRPLISMPDENLLFQLKNDSQLRIQSIALNAARASSDTASRIREAYKILEQEENRKQGYKAQPAFRHIRNSMSHAKLDDPRAKEYFQNELCADIPDLANSDHIKFLKQKAAEILNEAAKIVEGRLADHKFWQ